VELYQLKTFLAVVNERSLTRAAQRVFASVPATSSQIRALEEELGVTLFQRTRQGMEPTAAAFRLAREVEIAVRAAGRIHDEAAAIRGEARGHVKLGVVCEPAALRLDRVMATLVQRHPGLSLEVQRGLSLATLRAVRSGELDAAYVLCAEPQVEGVDLVRLQAVDLAVALPKAHFGAADKMTLADVCDVPWVATPADCAMRPHVEALFEQAGRKPPSGWTAGAESATREMVASGIGCGLMRLDKAMESERAGECRVWGGWRGRAWMCWVQRSTPAAVPSITAVREAVMQAWQVRSADATQHVPSDYVRVSPGCTVESSGR